MQRPGIEDSEFHAGAFSMRIILAGLIAASLGCLVTGATLAQIGDEPAAVRLTLEETIRQ